MHKSASERGHLSGAWNGFGALVSWRLLARMPTGCSASATAGADSERHEVQLYVLNRFSKQQTYLSRSRASELMKEEDACLPGTLSATRSRGVSR